MITRIDLEQSRSGGIITWSQVNRFINSKLLDKYIEKKCKSEVGFFEWEMSSVKVPLEIASAEWDDLSIPIERGRGVRFWLNYEIYFEGVVEEIDGEFDNKPILYAYPFGIIAKNTYAGTLDSDTGSYFWEFSDLTPEEVLSQLCGFLQSNVPDEYPGLVWTYDWDDTNPVVSLYGAVETQIFTSWVLGDTQSEQPHIRRTSSGDFYLLIPEEEDEEQGGFFHWHVYEFTEDGIVYEALEEHINGQYNWGTIYTGTTPAGWNSVWLDWYLQSTDHTYQSTHAVLRAGDAYYVILDDLESWPERLITIRFLDLFADNSFSGHFKDVTVADVLKWWSALTYHWLGFEGATINMPSRDANLGTVDIPAAQIKERDPRRSKYDKDIDLGIPIYESETRIDDDGEEYEHVTEYGLIFPQAAYDVLQIFYRELVEDDYIVSKHTCENLPDRLATELLKEVTVGYTQHGEIISERHEILGDELILTSLREGA